jgi:hypothetical protein
MRGSIEIIYDGYDRIPFFKVVSGNPLHRLTGSITQ